MHNEVKTTAKTVVLEFPETSVDIVRPVILFRHQRICSDGLSVNNMRAAILIGDKPDVDNGVDTAGAVKNTHVTPIGAQSGF